MHLSSVTLSICTSYFVILGAFNYWILGQTGRQNRSVFVKPGYQVCRAPKRVSGTWLYLKNADTLFYKWIFQVACHSAEHWLCPNEHCLENTWLNALPATPADFSFIVNLLWCVVDAYDREFRGMYEELPPRDKARMRVADRAPNALTVSCRRLFGNLEFWINDCKCCLGLLCTSVCCFDSMWRCSALHW